MNIVIPTVPHTGTIFITKLFIEKDFTQIALLETPYQDKTLFVGHIVKDGLTNRALELMKEYPAVIPLRHPYLVAESWKRRGKPVTDLVTAYKKLPELFDCLNPYYVPMDTEDRDDYLVQIEKGLGISLSHDWPIINSYQHTSDLNRDEIEPNELIIDLVSEIKPFLDRFYR